MRVLLVSLNFAPEPTGIGKYSGELAHALVAAGHEVRVVCAPPYYPQWQVASGYSAWAWRRERPAPRLEVFRCPTWVPRQPGTLARLLHLGSFAASSLPVLLGSARWRPDLVFVVVPALFTAPGAWLAARLCGARTWLHVQDFELDAAYGLGLLSGGWLRRGVETLERRLMGSFDRISTLSSRMRERLQAKGVDAARTALLPNWVDASVITPVAGPVALRDELGLPADALVCLYSGTMNRKQGLEVVVDAARGLRGRSDIVFLLCGQGDWRGRLEQAAADLPNLRFADLQPAARLNELLNLADIHLLPQAAGAADLVMPSKLGGMLASGRPVVATAAPGTEVAMVVEDCGVVVPPADAAALGAAITRLADDPARRRELGAAARCHALTHLDAAGVLRSFIDDARQLTGSLPPTRWRDGTNLSPRD